MGRFGYPEYVVGILQKLPLPKIDDRSATKLAELARSAWTEKFRVDEAHPLSHNFVTISLFLVPGENIKARTVNWLKRLTETNERITAIQATIDEVSLDLYALDAVSRHTISQMSTNTGNAEDGDDEIHNDDEIKTKDYVDLDIDSIGLVFELTEYLVGSVFGRWNIHHSTGDKPFPELPDPFAPLPICPPGMLQNAAGLPATPADVPADYPLRISWPGILVDDPGHSEDIEGRVRDALRVIWPDSADAIEQEACQILGVDSLRAYFANPNRFFDDHLKRYSKSRRYAPIYWPLSTPSGSYTLWLYYHRLDDQILYTCVNDFVDPKLAQVREQLTGLRTRHRTGGDEDELARLSDLALELQDFRTELLRLARVWRPNLNDGVQITAAPLFRLFPHRAWSNRLAESWEKLEAGEFDWAHLALSLWPARVVPKCVDDRSLAIAHDLEALFWVEDPPGAWRNLNTPDAEIAEQRRRHHTAGRRALRQALADLSTGRGAALSARQLCAHLTAGDWDDLPAARLLFPERVADKVWANPLLAAAWQITLPAKQTKKARREFDADLLSAGCPDVADLLPAALGEDDRPFPTAWADLSAGGGDHHPLALALWPDRVIDKSLMDVGVAEAVGLARFFWVDGRRRVVVGQEVVGELGRRG